MRTLNFAKRNFKELIREPLSIVFAIILPLFMLFIFQQFDIPNESYKIENFIAGIIVFGFSFITMFSANLIAKDRTTSLLIRLGISPMKGVEYILGYVLAILPLTVIQNILFFSLACILGLNFSIQIIFAILISIVISILFIALGMLIGSNFSEKASNGVSSIFLQLVCFTSGMFFPLELLGKGFRKVCEYLPFEASVNIIKGIINNNLDLISTKNIIVFVTYIVILLILSIIVFKKKMISDNK